MRHGSLFSGIGGFDLAAEWMGWGNVFHCEINEFGRKVLNYHFPKSISHEDITKTDFSVYRGRIDILSGGFPCQPFSSAGNRKGKDDERYLWKEMLRAIKEIAPSWIVGENVYGLINWSNGLVFHEIQTDLEAQGYEVFPFLCPAVSVNAPHVRNRIFFIAHAKFNTKGQNDRTNGEEAGAIRRDEESNVLGTLCGDGYAADTCDKGLQGDELNGTFNERKWEQGFTRIPIAKFHKISDWSEFPTVPPVCVRDDGFSNRLDDITFPKWRNESIKAAGNAVVPQVILQIFKTIADYERITTTDKN